MEKKKEIFEGLMKLYGVLNRISSDRGGYGDFYELYGKNIIGELIAKYFKEEIRPYLDTDGAIHPGKAHTDFTRKIETEKEIFVEKFKDILKEAGTQAIYLSFETGKLFILGAEDSNNRALKAYEEILEAILLEAFSYKDDPRKMN